MKWFVYGWNGEEKKTENEKKMYIERHIINPLHMFKLCVQCTHTVCLMRLWDTNIAQVSEWVNEWGKPKWNWKFRNINECIFQSLRRQHMMLLHIGNARREYFTTARKKECNHGNWKWCVKTSLCVNKNGLIEITCFQRIEFHGQAS